MAKERTVSDEAIAAALIETGSQKAAAEKLILYRGPQDAQGNRQSITDLYSEQCCRILQRPN